MAERQAALEVAIAELERAKALAAQHSEEVSRHTLYAPFSGVIAKRQINLGEWVTQQTPVFTLVEQDKLRLNLAIPQEYFALLNSSGSVEVTVVPDFAEATPISAKLDRLVSVAQGNSRTVTGLVNLPKGISLVTGMSARANIKLPTSDNTLVWLPKTAIKQHPDGGNSVFAVEANKAKRLLVKVVKNQGSQVAVSGVDSNANLPFVVSGVELIKNGDSLTVKTTSGKAL